MAELRIWAPEAGAVEVDIDGKRAALRGLDGGWWSIASAALRHGADYCLWVDGSGPWPDPRSAHQPHGIQNPSRWVDHAGFEWTDAQWRPLPLREALIYELHVGTFSPEGDFDGAIAHLDELVELGMTHVEVMPVAEFAGERGWGYDGVQLYAPHHAYGGPDGLKRFVNACHAKGLAVILDVVYNHLGPAGNCLEVFGPYFTDAYKTPWGKAVNLDGAWSHEVRRFFIDNALMWVRDYHIDGLRIDAVHALVDRSAIHFIEQLTGEVKALGKLLGTEPIVIAESDLNDPRVVRPVAQGGMGVDAQWNEDFHHALHTLLTGETFGYYSDFGSLGDLIRVLEAGFCYDDRFSPYRLRHHGRSAVGLEGFRFVACLQNHDQIGNRGAGERSGHLLDAQRTKLGAAVVLLAPFIPMLFQGEEWSASAPFQYFTDFVDPELQQNVRHGRRQEFAGFGWKRESIPDPQDPGTFERSKLDWSERDAQPHKAMLQWYGELIALRKQEADFGAGPLDAKGLCFDTDARWLVFRRGRFHVVCNFAEVELRLRYADLPASPDMRDILDRPLMPVMRVRLASSPRAHVGHRQLVLPAHAVAVLEPEPEQEGVRHE